MEELKNNSPFYLFFFRLSTKLWRFPKKSKKSLMTHLPAGRQGLNIDYADTPYDGEICVIKSKSV